MSTLDVDNWLSRFVLQPAVKTRSELQLATMQPNAAVLVPVFRHQGQWTVLMTRRALHLRHHPGQLSFPGGRIEKDELPAIAALREAYEETGIQPEQVTLLGQLPAINTSTGFIVQPWLGMLEQLPKLQIQTSEVDAVLLLPLHEALSPQRRQSEVWTLRGRQQLLHFIPWQDHLIWGASAEILYQLAQHVAHRGP